MYQQKTYRIKGLTPTMLHSGQLANPLSPIAKEIKRFTSKKKKTDEDLGTVSKLEWLGCFYFEKEGAFDVKGNDVKITASYGRPNWPAANIERMLQDAAAKNKLGKQFKAGVTILDDAPIIYDGPSTIDELFGQQRFSSTVPAKVQRSTVMRTRPIFREWELEFTVHFMPDIVDEHSLDEAVEIAGKLIGLSDYRPKYGRFEVQRAN